MHRKLNHFFEVYQFFSLSLSIGALCAKHTKWKVDPHIQQKCMPAASRDGSVETVFNMTGICRPWGYVYRIIYEVQNRPNIVHGSTARNRLTPINDINRIFIWENWMVVANHSLSFMFSTRSRHFSLFYSWATNRLFLVVFILTAGDNMSVLYCVTHNGIIITSNQSRKNNHNKRYDTFEWK